MKKIIAFDLSIKKEMKNKIIKLIKKIIGVKPNNSLEMLKKRGLKVGTNFKMLEECIIDDSHYWHIEIGNNVTLAPRVHILAHDASTKNFLNYTKVKNVFIGNDVFIGASSIILPGVTIGNNVIIGAGSVVTKDIPDNCLFAGNPAKFICNTDTYINKNKSEMTKNNVFEDDYTLRKNISFEKMQEMKHAALTQGVCFVN
jgi:maltose O-acetyltransferase